MAATTIGVVFPAAEIEPEPSAIRAYAQAAEDIGYAFISVPDHVVGAPVVGDAGARAGYDVDVRLMEPFAALAFFAACTSRIGLATNILVLPQRNAVLTAKQAATIDVLSSGRLRLGVAVGWNRIEFDAQGQEFRDRGARIEEQIAVMRKLWTNRTVSFRGEWHTLDGVGINPLPIQRPIPVWIGGSAPPVLDRVARLADGWLPTFEPDGFAASQVEKVRALAVEHHRDPTTIGLEGRIRTRAGGPDDWKSNLERWNHLGARQVLVDFSGRGLVGADDHIAAMQSTARLLRS